MQFLTPIYNALISIFCLEELNQKTVLQLPPLAAGRSLMRVQGSEKVDGWTLVQETPWSPKYIILGTSWMWKPPGRSLWNLVQHSFPQKGIFPLEIFWQKQVDAETGNGKLTSGILAPTQTHTKSYLVWLDHSTPMLQNLLWGSLNPAEI